MRDIIVKAKILPLNTLGGNWGSGFSSWDVNKSGRCDRTLDACHGAPTAMAM